MLVVDALCSVPRPACAGLSGEDRTASRCMLGAGRGANPAFLVVETQKGRACAMSIAFFEVPLKPIDRRRFQAIVDRHDGDAYDKSFKSWDHLVALIYAQLGHVVEPAWDPADLQCERPSSLSFECRQAVPFDPVGCECSPSSRGFRANLRDAGESGRPADTTRGCRDGAPDRCQPHPVGQDVQVGQVERTHSGHENARRLSSPCRLPTRRRDHSCQRQRCRNRQPSGDRERRDLRLRQRLLSLRMVEEDQ